MTAPHQSAPPSLRARLHEVIAGTHTRAGRLFDIVLLIVIFLSVLAVMLESVPLINARYGPELLAAEWIITIIFTIEYAVRLYSAPRPLQYARSFYGVIDLVAILPTYLSLFLPGAQALLVVRGLRLVRIFRILKLPRYVSESNVLIDALRASRPKITVFILTVVTLLFVVGAAMYLVEGESAGFNSIPISVYWAVVTMTTVGYGDIVPATPLGKALACMLMICGYGIIAVPTGIVTAEIAAARNTPLITGRPISSRTCPECVRSGHDRDAAFCKYCAAELPPLPTA